MPPRDRSRSRERGGRQQQQQGTGATVLAAGVEMGNAFALLERFLSKHEALRVSGQATCRNKLALLLIRWPS
jgi:hypothetical protein